MNSPRRFSTAFETYARFGATLEAWRTACGDEFPAVEPLLAPTDGLAATWPGRLPSRPDRRVVRLDGARFRAVCDEGLSEPIDLSQEQLVLYRADERALRGAVCEALGLTISPDDLRPLPGLLRLGRWRYSPAAGCAVSLACAATPLELAELLRLAGSDGRPHIVLVFTRAVWAAEAERAAPADRMLVAAFDEVLEPAPGGLAASDGWDAALGQFTKAAKIVAAPGFREQKKKRVAKIRAAVTPWSTHRPISPARIGSIATTNDSGGESSVAISAVSGVRPWNARSWSSSPGSISTPVIARAW